MVAIGHGACPPSQAAVSLEHVTLTYGTTAALDDVSLAIGRGERLCVLGANGSGKSTLASVISGLLAPDGGTVRIGDNVVCTDEGGVNFDAYARARREVGLVFQNPDDQIVTTVVEEDVAFGPENLGVAPHEIGRRVERELRRVAMDGFAKENPSSLSGGQKQRVALAGALAMEPRILVLDEPGALLDVRGRRGIMRVLGELHDLGITLVHVTHFMDEALEADRVVVLDAGHVVTEGPPSDVFARVGDMGIRGLELPFIARVATELRQTGLDLPFTCDERELADAIVTRSRIAAPPQEGAADEVPPCAGKEDDANTMSGSGASPRETREVISVDGVTFSYADGDHGFHALDGISLRVAGGTHATLVGHTGSGKSTLLRLLCALETPDAGSVRVLGVETSSRRTRRALRGRVGYVMQHPERQLFAETVWDDVAFGPRNQGRPDDEVERCVRAALHDVGLVGREQASPFQLSGGQQRLCAIAGILAMQPELLVLDEPMAGLDPVGRRGLRSLLDHIHGQGTTIVEVTHSMDEAALADHVIVLSRGRVLLEGAPREVFATHNASLLRRHGLGLPRTLALASRLEADGMAPLGNPLSIAACVRSIAAQLVETGGPAQAAPSSQSPAGDRAPAYDGQRTEAADHHGTPTPDDAGARSGSRGGA